MQIILSHFMTLDGVVQAPGGRKEDTDGEFAHGGWSMKYFDPEAMGPAQALGRAAVRAAHLEVAAGAWPKRGGDPLSDRPRDSDAAAPARASTSPAAPARRCRSTMRPPGALHCSSRSRPGAPARVPSGLER